MQLPIPSVARGNRSGGRMEWEKEDDAGQVGQVLGGGRISSNDIAEILSWAKSYTSGQHRLANSQISVVGQCKPVHTMEAYFWVGPEASATPTTATTIGCSVCH